MISGRAETCCRTRTIIEADGPVGEVEDDCVVLLVDVRHDLRLARVLELAGALIVLPDGEVDGAGRHEVRGRTVQHDGIEEERHRAGHRQGQLLETAVVLEIVDVVHLTGNCDTLRVLGTCAAEVIKGAIRIP